MTTEELVSVFGQSLAENLPDYQVVFLPTPHPVPVELEALEAAEAAEAATDEGVAFPYEFSAFGSPVGLRLRRNHGLIAPSFRVLLRGAGDPDQDAAAEGERLQRDVPRCHFLHRGEDDGVVAALSMCHPRSVHGLVVRGNDSLEIWPLPERLQGLQRLRGDLPEAHVAHVVKRVPLDRHRYLFSADDAVMHPDVEAVLAARGQEGRGGAQARLVLETALFLDEAAYRLYAPFVSHDEAQLRDLVLAYLNGVQALYHHPSLGRAVDIVLVRLELFRTQPHDLPHHDGDRSPLLDSFCEYNERHNPSGDEDPHHWDMGLYVSGLDFFAYENGRKSGVTMGLATVGGVCLDRYACVIAELGTVNVFGKPYPSAGFTSVYILAHEIGHNLGMHHDSTSNSCPKDGFIMSPSRGTQGEAVWSSCSQEVLQQTQAECLTDRPRAPPKDMDHMAVYKDEPGQAWGAKKQCEMLLRDHDAELRYPSRLSEICDNLQCRTPHRSGFYFAGPALTGTSCGMGRWCQGGQCVVMKRKKPIKVVKGGWSPWRSEPCQSGCISKARGFQKRRRTCTNPRPVNTDEGCEGSSVDVVLCKDDHVCPKKKRPTVVEYASSQCRLFAALLPDLDPTGAGLQAPHEQGRLWMSCAIFCRRKDTGSYYTPRLDLNDMGVNAYFPDGTWCHGDSSGSYYCQQRHCLPEGFQISKVSHWLGTDDVPMPQNALPHSPALPHPPLLLSYLGLGADGRPLLDQLPPGAATPPPDDAWSDRDYVELPAM
ncbi:hypothetical protein ONE63_010813 [Megalurothrips usitatus]|uniref:Peptidase M12B domain-containing protein n=1 Tax=Megalurothrips usitatus TaxID=439358 RepID=A0AAV7XI73_9NEOP|nr:hypothetical protein ONE63_010813 [Megalurothrips usitatus]